MPVIALHIVDNDGSIVESHPACNTFPHIHGKLLDILSFGTQGYLKIKFLFFFIDDEQTRSIPLAELGGRFKYLGQKRMNISIIGIDKGADFNESIEFFDVNYGQHTNAVPVKNYP
jgi:hypothetical protein